MVHCSEFWEGEATGKGICTVCVLPWESYTRRQQIHRNVLGVP